MSETKIRVEEYLKNAEKYEKLLDYDKAITMRKYALLEMNHHPLFSKELLLELRLKNATDYEKLLAYEKAIEAYYEAYTEGHYQFHLSAKDEEQLFNQVDRIMRLINSDNVKSLKLLDDDDEHTLQIWYNLGMDDSAIDIAKLLVEKRQFEKAIKIYKLFDEDNVDKIRKLIADDKVKHLDYEKAIEIYESLGDKKSAKRVRKLKTEQSAVKVDQTVVHGDQITKTKIKDSVLNRSNVGGGSSKMQELKDLTDMKEKGLLDDDEFNQMKKEILKK